MPRGRLGISVKTIKKAKKLARISINRNLTMSKGRNGDLYE